MMSARLSRLLVLFLLTGCSRDSRLPTAISRRVNDLEATAPDLAARNEGMRETMPSRDQQHWPHHAIVAEAREALLVGAATGELTYRQQYATFTDVADTADFRVALRVCLGDWALTRYRSMFYTRDANQMASLILDHARFWRDKLSDEAPSYADLIKVRFDEHRGDDGAFVEWFRRKYPSSYAAIF